MMKNPENISEYIESFPAETQKKLNRTREVIKKAAPGASEKISYGMPTFYLNGNLVHFAGYKNHIGFYPTASGIARFKEELSSYETSKVTVRFPKRGPIPWGLITKIVKFRYRENLDKVKPGKSSKK